jgi:hypothetical protein
MNNELNDNIEELDSTWLQEFQNLDNEYKNYYTEDLLFIRIHSIYLNTNSEIEKISEEKILLKNAGHLQKEELLSVIKHNSFFNNIKYSLLSILKFNINIEPIHLNNFLRNKDKNIGASFLQSVKNIDSIKFDKSISIFHDINDILIIFHKKKISKDNQLRNRTKKIFINSNTKKKTKRKEFKENDT